MSKNFFSVTSINRFMAKCRARSAQRERDSIIEQNSRMEKDLPTRYELKNVEFDKETRIANVQFSSIKKYRTIERYVTRNYTRYPVYSSWKTKYATIDKKLKLTNKCLESLNYHEDCLVREFAAQIILSLNDPDLIPSWLSCRIIRNDCREIINNYEIQINHLKEDFQMKVDENTSYIDDLLANEELLHSKLNKQNKAHLKIQKKMDYINTHTASAFKCIITFGIYALLFTRSRRKRIENTLLVRAELVNSTQIEIDEIGFEIEEIRTQQDVDERELNKKIKEISKHIVDKENKCKERLSQVKKLESYIYTDDFILLRDFIGFDYETIKGCYIIHNREKDRYYVGQSKDIMKRIKQHFKGTTPNNIIFAEDYFNALYSDRSCIFEIKIIPLETKDELDSVEAKLIEEYEANISGYNSTKGNK